MKIKIIKSILSGPTWQKYIGKEFESIKFCCFNNFVYYRLSDGSYWLSKEVEITKEENHEQK